MYAVEHIKDVKVMKIIFYYTEATHENDYCKITVESCILLYEKGFWLDYKRENVSLILIFKI